MQSTFHGLETARRAMMTQQYALHTVGQNIANANTQGYTRQRVNFAPTEPYPNVGRNAPRIPGQIGTGVQAGSVQRIRDQFLDIQFRNEFNKEGYWATKVVAFEKLEDVLNEPSNEGLKHQIDEFWKAFQELSTDPEDAGARRIVRQRAVAVTETFHHLHDSLTTIHNDYKEEIEVTEKEINRLFKELEDINQKVREAEPHGYVTNDLYDKQDLILDKLSSMLNIQVKREESSGDPSAAAEGAVTVILIDDSGKQMLGNDGEPIVLVDGTGQLSYKRLAIEFSEDESFVSRFTLVDEDENELANIDLDTMPRGAMKGLIEAFGYGASIDDVKGILPDMFAEIDLLAETFANQINEVHQIGFTLPDLNGNVELGSEFFDLSKMGDGVRASKAISVHQNIEDSLDNIAAAGVSLDDLAEGKKEEYENLLNAERDEAYYENIRNFLNDPSSYSNGVPVAYEGDATNARRLADVKDLTLQLGENTATIGSYYQGMIGDLGVKASEAIGMRDNAEGLKAGISYRRDAVSSVSLDEELTLLIQFQHAYNAAARNITLVDEMLDRIINGMGVVGR